MTSFASLLLMRTILLPLTALLAISGCASAEPEAKTAEGRAAWIGALEGTDARVGLVREGAQVALYVCGGPTSMPATRWFRGSVRGDGAIELSSTGASVRAALDASGWSGTLTMAPDPVRTFTLRAARTGSAEDLYEGTLDGGSVGVVVTENTMQGVLRALDGSTFQVLPVRTVVPGPQGLSVSVKHAGGVREFFVLPARAR